MQPKTPILLCILAAILLLNPTQGAILRVSDTGDGSDGLSWQTAFRKPSDAMASASNGDEIWIKEGTYNDRSVVTSSISLYGGFEGVENETDFGSRDPGSRPTIIDGSGLGDSVMVFTDISEATVDGLTITGGEALFGGGIRMSGTHLVVYDCVFEKNKAQTLGGALYVSSNSFLDISGTVIKDNSATSDANNCGGGGIAIGSNSHAAIAKLRFRGNYALCRGGALYVASFVNSSAEVSDCLFAYNWSDGPGHAIHGEVIVYSSLFHENGNPTDPKTETLSGAGESLISDSTIRYSYGGGIKNFKGGIERCHIIENRGIGISSAFTLIAHSEIIGNHIGVQMATSVLTDSMIANNDGEGISGGGEISRCTISGNGNGGIVVNEPSIIETCLVSGNSAFNGGGVSLDPDGTLLKYCTIADNTAEESGGGLFVRPHSTGVEEIPPVVNSCVIASNRGNPSNSANIGHSTFGPGPGSEPSGPPNVSYSFVGGGFEGDGNVNGTSPFVNAAKGDFQLLIDSPCIDSASTNGPGADLDGRIRPIDITGIGREGPGAFDMGAFEFDYSRADLNEDGKVDELDLMIFQQDWYRQIEIQ
ncbi:MAG: hypothetical protein KC964_12230 [Candidatus Omnitrophica bacterium]|nr:hypothetical protein [Candidatus Omnitrophota bacterium]